MNPNRSGLLDWWHAANAPAKRALIEASLGWALDAFDVMLFAMVLASVIPALGLTKPQAGALGSITLVAGAAGVGVLTAEIYPTAIRATAQGFTYNAGRIASAAAPFVVGSLAATRGFGAAFAVTGSVFVLAAIAWIWIPETRGRELA